MRSSGRGKMANGSCSRTSGTWINDPAHSQSAHGCRAAVRRRIFEPGGMRRPALAFLEPLLQPVLGFGIGVGRDSPAAAGIELQELAIEAQQILGLCRVRRASDRGLGIL